jgi:hypothetical protein
MLIHADFVAQTSGTAAVDALSEVFGSVRLLGGHVGAHRPRAGAAPDGFFDRYPPAVLA